MEREVRGAPTNISSKKIMDAIKEVETIIKKGDSTQYWKAV